MAQPDKKASRTADIENCLAAEREALDRVLLILGLTPHEFRDSSQRPDIAKITAALVQHRASQAATPLSREAIVTRMAAQLVEREKAEKARKAALPPGVCHTCEGTGDLFGPGAQRSCVCPECQGSGSQRLPVA